jgi:hypothetical protein
LADAKTPADRCRCADCCLREHFPEPFLKHCWAHWVAGCCCWELCSRLEERAGCCHSEERLPSDCSHSRAHWLADLFDCYSG